MKTRQTRWTAYLVTFFVRLNAKTLVYIHVTLEIRSRSLPYKAKLQDIFVWYLFSIVRQHSDMRFTTFHLILAMPIAVCSITVGDMHSILARQRYKNLDCSMSVCEEKNGHDPLSYNSGHDTMRLHLRTTWANHERWRLSGLSHRWLTVLCIVGILRKYVRATLR